MIRSVVLNLVVALAMFSMIMPVQGQLVSTGDALALETGVLEHRIEAYFLRDGVAAELAEFGVSHDMAMERVANMSPEELEQIAGRIDEAPAGAGIIYVLGVVFLVMIVLHFFRR